MEILGHDPTLSIVHAVGTAIVSTLLHALTRVAKASEVAIKTTAARAVLCMETLEKDVGEMKVKLGELTQLTRDRSDSLAKTLETRASSLDEHIQQLNETLRTRDLS